MGEVSLAIGGMGSFRTFAAASTEVWCADGAALGDEKTNDRFKQKNSSRSIDQAVVFVKEKHDARFFGKV
jgi:hypothetical protein